VRRCKGRKGLKKGIKEKETQVIVNMLNHNINIALISKYTGVEISEIKKIKSKS